MGKMDVGALSPPCRNTLFTSNCCKFQPYFVAIGNFTQTAFVFAIQTNISK